MIAPSTTLRLLSNSCLATSLRIASTKRASRVDFRRALNVSPPRSSAVRVMATKSVMKMALCQIKVSADKMQNIDTARAAIQTAASNEADLVMLPEIWNCPYSNDSFPVYCEPIPEAGEKSASSVHDSPSFQMMREAAERHGIYLVGGSVPETKDGKLYNTCCVFDRLGSLIAKHRKVHLFDIDIPGKITFKESETLTPGDHPTLFDTEFGKCAVGICYDIRFAELALLYAKNGAKLIVYPGAFNTTTGPAHWELLQRARAADNQVFVAMCSPARNEDGYQAWGHSTVSGPFGEVIATCEEKPTTVYATVDFNDIEERRRNMPLQFQKRKDIYDLLQTSPALAP